MKTQYITLILAAGARNFELEEGHTKSKFDFDVDGESLISRVTRSYQSKDSRLVIAESDLNYISGSQEIRVVPIGSTQGALISALVGLKDCDLSLPLIITPGDALLAEEKYSEFVKHSIYSDAAISLIVFNSDKTDYSYIRTIDGTLVEACEKKVISSLATAGFYYFNSAELFVECAEWAILNNIRTNNSFFLAPALNYAVILGSPVSLFMIEESQYYRFSYLQEAIESEIRYKSANQQN